MNIHRYSLPNQICIDLHSKTAPSTLSFSKFLPSKLIFFHYKKCLTTAVTGSTIKSTFYIIRMSSKVECKAAGQGSLLADDTFKVDLCGKNILFRILHTHLARLKKVLLDLRDPLIMESTTVHMMIFSTTSVGISRSSFDALQRFIFLVVALV